MSEEKVVIVETNTMVKPEGKGAAISGFILALLGIVIPFNVIAVLAGSAVVSYIGLAICLVSVILCAMAMGKLKKSGAKRGLAVAGLVVGLVASVWMILGVMGINSAIDARNQGITEFQRELNNM